MHECEGVYGVAKGVYSCSNRLCGKEVSHVVYLAKKQKTKKTCDAACAIRIGIGAGPVLSLQRNTEHGVLAQLKLASTVGVQDERFSAIAARFEYCNSSCPASLPAQFMLHARFPC